MVSTDDEEIAGISISCGAEVIKRPLDLSVDTATSESALLNIIGHLENVERIYIDLIVFLQCTSPLRKRDDIDNAIKTLIDKDADSLFSVFRFNKYIWRVENNSIMPMNYDYQQRWREQDFPFSIKTN